VCRDLERLKTKQQFQYIMCLITVRKDNPNVSDGERIQETPAMISRGCVERDLEIIAEFIFKAAQIASNVQREHGKLSKDFLKGLQHNMEIPELRTSIKEFASQFEMSGFDVSAMKYNS